MLELLETITGAIALVVYLGVGLALPILVLIAFVVVLARLLSAPIASVARSLRQVDERVLRTATWLVAYAIAIAALLALAGATADGDAGLFTRGASQVLVALSAAGDLAASWITGYEWGDLVLVVRPPPGAPPSEALRLLGRATGSHLYDVLRPGTSLVAFRWAVATTLSVGALTLALWTAYWGISRRPARPVAAAQPPAAASGSDAPSGRPAMAGVGEIPAGPRERCGIVASDTTVAGTLRTQLEEAGCEAVVYARLADALAPQAARTVVFMDASELERLSPELLPPMYAGKIVAVPRAGAIVPRGWNLDTHPLEAGSRGISELLRARGRRTRLPA